MPPRIRYAALTVVLITLLSGCGSSRLQDFPDFPAHKARLEKGIILADFLLIRATNTDTAVVDLAANKTTADKLLTYAGDHLIQKGYNVTDRVLSSVGLLMDRERGVSVSRTSELDPEEGGGTLYLHPPFYLYQPLRRDTVLRGLLETVYRTLARSGDDPARLPKVGEIVPLGRAFGAGMVFIFLGGGYEIPPAVAAGGVSPPAGEMLAGVGYQPVTQASLHLYVLNALTGEIIWADHQIKQGGVNYDGKYLSMAENLLEDIP